MTLLKDSNANEQSKHRERFREKFKFLKYLTLNIISQRQVIHGFIQG